MAYDTLEEAQAHILELDEEIEGLKKEKETLSKDNESLNKKNEDLRTLNQKYFNKLIAQDDVENKEDDEEDEETPTCEEFAMKLLERGF